MAGLKDTDGLSAGTGLSIVSGLSSGGTGLSPGPSTGGTPAAPVNVLLPVVFGSTVVGQTVISSSGTWSGYPTPTYTYQWLLGGTPITGATSSSYLIVSGDVGGMLSCQVTATNTEGFASATSAEVGPVTAAATENTLVWSTGNALTWGVANELTWG